MARQFHVQGTRTFYTISIVLLVLGIWCVKDGWFPAASVLAKHPMWTPEGHLDNFYLFNRSLAVISLIGSAVCGYIHRIVR